LTILGGTLLGLALFSRSIFSFCGFYVSKADTKLFNKASQVVLVRDGDKTVLTMANDFRGDPKEFAVVIPVPTFIKKEQIHIGDKALIEHLDAYSAPRLVEYYDGDPCAPVMFEAGGVGGTLGGLRSERRTSFGVSIEARYTVGEYDILILSAQQSHGLETWLGENGYRIPPGASSVLGSYLKQGMRFFVARVNLAEQSRLGYSVLRPIQVAYETPKFMLPIRLGMVNAEGPQDLFVYTLTRKGRVETTNYRTAKLPADMDLPLFLKDKNEFGNFYKAMFSRQVEKEDMRAVFLEYAWDMGWCDPCAADPLSAEELRQLGVFWLEASSGANQIQPGRIVPPVAARDVFLTRLHVRYDAQHFPEDLVFQETADRTNFQGRYVLRHPWKGEGKCPLATEYRGQLPQRNEREAENLSLLTGWNLQEIRQKMKLQASVSKPWWERLWKGNDAKTP